MRLSPSLSIPARITASAASSPAPPQPSDGAALAEHLAHLGQARPGAQQPGRRAVRNRCAVMSASPARAARVTIAETAFLVSGPSGASSVLKTCRHEQPGRPSCSQSAIACPASTGSGS
jgi:hypothetical protein